MNATCRLAFLAAVLLLAGLCRLPAATAAEEQSLRAFSTFQAQGQLTKTGENEVTYVGMLTGRFYIDTDQGPVDAGTMTCPVVVHMNLKKATQRGEGQCVFIGPRGNTAYMDLTCTGVPLVGCGGDSKFTGGTGPLAGISGGGSFVLRSNLQELRLSTGPSFQDTTAGIIFWRELHYKLP